MAELMKTHLQEIIEAANAKFMQLFAEAKFEELAELYSAEGILMPPNSDLIQGRQVIGGFWKAVSDMGIKSASLHTLGVEDCGNLCVEHGLYELFGAEKQMLDKGKYVVAWKREEGDWKLYRDIFNTSLSAQK